MKALVTQASARYRARGRFAEGFAKGKMSGDPAYAAVLERLPARGLVADLGCGEGYLLALVRAARPALDLWGVDHDPARVALGQEVLAGEERLTLEVGDARTAALPRAALIACLDLLHYMIPAEQDALIGRLAASLQPGGLLLIRDGETGGGLKSFLLGLSERVAVALGRHKGDGVFFRSAEELRAALEAEGLVVEVLPCRQGTPFANVLFQAKKPESP
ncbi:MAG: class I SAM-dependent methyltransferase [Pseudomonadota bacterium]